MFEDMTNASALSERKPPLIKGKVHLLTKYSEVLFDFNVTSVHVTSITKYPITFIRFWQKIWVIWQSNYCCQNNKKHNFPCAFSNRSLEQIWLNSLKTDYMYWLGLVLTHKQYYTQTQGSAQYTFYVYKFEFKRTKSIFLKYISKNHKK